MRRHEVLDTLRFSLPKLQGLGVKSIAVFGSTVRDELRADSDVDILVDFGDGATSAEQHPQHAYQKPGPYVVALYVEGPDGKSRRAKVWDVDVK